MSDDFFAGLDDAVETLRLGTTSERVAALVKLSSELVTALDARQALLTVGEAVRHMCGGERFLAVDHERQVVAARDHEGTDLVTPLELCREIVEQAMSESSVQFAYLPQRSPRWREVASARPYVGMIAVPLLTANGLRGVICVDSKSTFLERLEPALAEVLLLLGRHAAAVIENAEMLEKVNRDPTNELQTLAYFERRLGEELKRSARYQRPFSILLVEMLDAHACMSRYGHTGLDSVLGTLGTVLRAECRQPDVLARVGPARLAVLCPELRVNEGETQRVIPKELAARWRKKCELVAFKIGDVPQKVSLRVGAVTYQQAPVLALKGVMHEADLALEVAKREGEDHYVVR
ncbi:MAG: diguanylate cyclase [Deltaproteobacteria bacterium]|nr:diguanylate cyclase [Deltaproteobacteria bacterium]